MPTFNLTLPIKLMTNNQLHRTHWAKKARYQKELECHLLAAMGRNRSKMCPAQGHRFASFVCHVKRFQDPDNLVGSLKPLIDAMRHVGLLFDDTSEFLTLAVDQKKAKEYKVDIEIREAGE